MARTIPAGYHAVTPVINYKDARKAIEFYKQAFGAKEVFSMPGPGGKGVMHADLTIGDSHVMLEDESPEQRRRGAETLGGTPVTFYLYVSDVDAAYKLAIAAGATSTMPLQDMFWGDRCATVSDPFGYSWMLATHVKDVSEADMKKALEQTQAAA